MLKTSKGYIYIYNGDAAISSILLSNIRDQTNINVCLCYFQCLKRWGYRRCEDICWIKTNIENPTKSKTVEPRAILKRTKVYCMVHICILIIGNAVVY